MTQDFIYNMDVLIPIVQLTSNERYFSAGWLNKSVLIQSQKLCCKSFLLPDIRATLSFFSWILFQSLKRRVSKHINLENKSVANVFFGTLETPFSTKCNVRPLMRVLLIFFKFNFSFEGGEGQTVFFFTVTNSRLMITKRRRFGKNKLGALSQSRLALSNWRAL